MRSAALWLGVLGAPLAWATQLVVGYGVEEADCGATHPVAVWLSVGTGLFALASLLSAAWLLRETRTRYVDLDARGRIAFMATAGLLTGFLFLALIVVTAIGVTHFEPCRPG